MSKVFPMARFVVIFLVTVGAAIWIFLAMTPRIGQPRPYFEKILVKNTGTDSPCLPYSPDLAQKTLKNGKLAIVYLGFPFSVLPVKFYQNSLSQFSKKFDMFEIKVDWNNQRLGNPFYDDFGMHKDGFVVVMFPNGEIASFTHLQMAELKSKVSLLKIGKAKGDATH